MKFHIADYSVTNECDSPNSSVVLVTICTYIESEKRLNNFSHLFFDGILIIFFYKKSSIHTYISKN